MVKLLGIVGSPRRGGNTESILMEVLRAAEGEGAETELIHLTDYDIRSCSGCDVCLETGNCVIEDDMEKVTDKMSEADGMVIGSPTYFYSATAQVKAFIDRVGFLDRSRVRERFRNKIGGAVAVAAREEITGPLCQILMFLADSRMILVSPLVKVMASEGGCLQRHVWNG